VCCVATHIAKHIALQSTCYNSTTPTSCPHTHRVSTACCDSTLCTHHVITHIAPWNTLHHNAHCIMIAPYMHHVLTLIASAHHVMTLHYTHHVVAPIASLHHRAHLVVTTPHTHCVVTCITSETHCVMTTHYTDYVTWHNRMITHTCLIVCNCLDSFYILAAICTQFPPNYICCFGSMYKNRVWLVIDMLRFRVQYWMHIHYLRPNAYLSDVL